MAKKAARSLVAGGDVMTPDGRLGPSSSEQDLKWQGLFYIRDRIFSGEYPPGSIISALGIAKRLREEKGGKWSRSPVREAMEILASEGLIRWKGIAGAEVQTLDKEDLFDSLTLRYAIETQVGLRLGREHDLDKVAVLRGILEEMAKLHAKSGGKLNSGPTPEWDEKTWEWFALDKQFHVRMAELSGMRRAAGYIANQMDHYLLFATQVAGREGDILGEHARILDAIESFDPADVEGSSRKIQSAFKEHMVGTARRYALGPVSRVEDLW